MSHQFKAKSRISGSGSVNTLPFKNQPHKLCPQDVDEGSDTYDTIDWLLKTSPLTTAEWAAVALRTQRGLYSWKISNEEIAKPAKPGLISVAHADCARSCFGHIVLQHHTAPPGHVRKR